MDTATETVPVKKAAEMLGIHTNTVRRLIASGEIAAARVGRRILVLKRPLMARLGLVTQTSAEVKNCE